MNRLLVRELTSLPEIEPLERLQELIWGYGRQPGLPFPYPARCLFEFAESGGLIEGAFAEDRLVGFSAAWIGLDPANGGLYLHSQLLGVLQECRDLGVGKELKLCQRAFARKRGIPVIKWTFDPLQPRNAYFNWPNWVGRYKDLSRTTTGR